MLTKTQIKFIHSLQLKKYRYKYKAFIAEGDKTVLSLLDSELNIKSIFALKEWIILHEKVLKKHTCEIIEVNTKDLVRLSSLTTPNKVLAVVNIPQYVLGMKELRSLLTIVLDDIQDPGNMGTIIRIADWYGIKNIICSINSVDAYNVKVVQATMGSIANVRMFYKDLPLFLKHTQGIPVYGATLKGKNIHTTKLTREGFIVLGNEADGISKEIMSYINHSVTIPSFGKINSLNVAIAAAIICDNFKRNKSLF